MKFNIENNYKISTYKYFFKLVVLTLLILGFQNSSGLAQNNNARSLILSDSYSEHYLAPYIICHKDKTNQETAEDVILMNELQNKPSDFTGSIAALGTTNEAMWLVFNVMNRSSKTKWKIDFGDSFMGRFGLLKNVESYVYNYKTLSLVRSEPLNDNSISLFLPIDERSEVLIKVNLAKGIPTTIPLRLVKQDNKTSYDKDALLLISSVFLVGMAFFFAAIALIQSNHKYLYFSVYYFSLTALLVIQSKLIVANFYFIHDEILPFLFLIVSTSGLMTARLFWNMEEQSSFSNFILNSFIALCFALFITGVILPIDSSEIKSLLLFGPSVLIVMIIPLVSIVQSQQGNDEVTPFMLGWFILLFGVCISVLSLSGIMPPVSAAINAYWYTIIPQALFFMFAVKIKMMVDGGDKTLSKTVEINETDSISRLRQSKENLEQERLLKVIEQERKVLGELRKSEARRTEEMRKAKDEADLANNAKSAFLAVVSHEIRTPMTGIMGMVRLLLDSNLTRDQKEYAQTIQDSSDAMLALLNDILDFEKIEQGKMNFENIDFDIHRLIQGVATLMNGHAAQKNIELKTKIGENLPRYIKGDPTRLRQVLLNLTGNAVKFTDEGHVTITAELIGQNQDNTYEIYFSVSDSGIGISKQAQKDLFTPFSQADSSISRKFGGTGLGLAISKGLIQAMGSAININSNEGEGSTFFYTLNMHGGVAENTDRQINTQQSPSKKEDKALHILIVDDNAINQKVIKGFLDKTNYILDTANSAEKALEKVQSKKYNLVLMDIELPGMNGDEATKQIRHSNNSNISSIPIIALTGNMMPQDIEKYQKAGMNDFVEKPIDPEKLKTVIKEVASNPSPQIITEQNKKITEKITTSKTVPCKSIDQEITEPAIKKAEVFLPATLDSLKGHIKKADLQEMISDVILKNEEIVQNLKSALTEEKNEEMSARAHELKGMAGNFGLMEISNQAGQIETKAKSAPNIVLAGLINPLPEMQKRAKEALDHWISTIED